MFNSNYLLQRHINRKTPCEKIENNNLEKIFQKKLILLEKEKEKEILKNKNKLILMENKLIMKEKDYEIYERKIKLKEEAKLNLEKVKSKRKCNTAKIININNQINNNIDITNNINSQFNINCIIMDENERKKIKYTILQSLSDNAVENFNKISDISDFVIQVISTFFNNSKHQSMQYMKYDIDSNLLFNYTDKNKYEITKYDNIKNELENAFNSSYKAIFNKIPQRSPMDNVDKFIKYSGIKNIKEKNNYNFEKYSKLGLSEKYTIK
jgi:hypothetical protein